MSRAACLALRAYSGAGQCPACQVPSLSLPRNQSFTSGGRCRWTASRLLTKLRRDRGKLRGEHPAHVPFERASCFVSCRLVGQRLQVFATRTTPLRKSLSTHSHRCRGSGMVPLPVHLEDAHREIRRLRQKLRESEEKLQETEDRNAELQQEVHHLRQQLEDRGLGIRAGLNSN